VIAQIKFTVTGKTADQIIDNALTKLADFMPDEPKDKWRVVLEIHEHGECSEWIGHATVRRKRERPDWDDDF